MNDAPIVTHADLRRLDACAQRLRDRDAEALESLEEDLRRAHPVDALEVPADVVTLDSRVTVRDLDTDRAFDLTLAAPGEADAGAGRVSVLAPLGRALYGRRVGGVARWESPAGPRRVRIEGLLHQPEAALRATARPALSA